MILVLNTYKITVHRSQLNKIRKILTSFISQLIANSSFTFLQDIITIIIKYVLVKRNLYEFTVSLNPF